MIISWPIINIHFLGFQVYIIIRTDCCSMVIGSDVERLVKLLQPDMSREELDWAKRWAQGPLSVRQTRRIPLDILLSSQNPSLELQADLARLERRSERGIEIGRFLLLIRDFGLSKASEIDSNPVIEHAPELLHLHSEDNVNNLVETPRVVMFGNVSERDLVQDLVYAMQGIDGKFVSLLDMDSDKLNFSPHIMSAVTYVSQVGVMHRSILSLFSDSQRKGILFTAFKSAISKELKEHLSLAALVDGNIEKWTLLKLVAWLTVPVRKIRFLESLVKRVCSTSQNELLNILYESKKQKKFQKSSSNIFNHVVSVWLEMVEAWVVKGQVTHPEFFIQRAASPGSTGNDRSNYIWRHEFEVRGELVPDFLSLADRESIKLIGKGSAFIRTCCTDHVEIPVENLERFKCIDSLTLDLQSVGDPGNQRVVNLLLNEYSLLEHLKSIKRSLLLAQGDFADTLMEMSCSELRKPASQQNKYQLGTFLDSAIRNSNLLDACTDVQNRIQVLLGPPVDVTDNGFEIFELNYLVTPPLDVVLNPEAILTYRKCFSFIWNVVRCDRALSKAWKDLQVVARQVASLPAFYTLSAVSELIHKANLVRTNLGWFIRELRAMVCYDVVETQWRALEVAIPHATNVEQLINSHESFLLGIEQGVFLTQPDDDLLAETLSILGIVVRFSDSLPAILSELSCAITAREDISEFRRKNINTLLEDLNDRSNDSFSGLFEFVEDRRQKEERSEFFERLSQRLIQRDESLDRI